MFRIATLSTSSAPSSHIHSRRAAVPASRPSNKKLMKKKPGRNNRQQRGRLKYGLEVPKKWSDDAVRIDRATNTYLWQATVEKEMAALIYHGCFKLQPPAGFKPASDYQFAPLQMVYDVKADLTRKARHVVMGNVVDPRGLSTRATVVKGIYVRLLNVIAHRDGLKMLCGDIGNAFIQATTREKIFTRCGPKFDDKSGCIAIIEKTLYGLTASAERFRTLLADFLRGMGFVPTHYDRDIYVDNVFQLFRELE